MTEITDTILISRLNARYRLLRQGMPVRGIETRKKSWYANEKVGMYQLCRVVNNKPSTVIIAIPFSEL